MYNTGEHGNVRGITGERHYSSNENDRSAITEKNTNYGRISDSFDELQLTNAVIHTSHLFPYHNY